MPPPPRSTRFPYTTLFRSGKLTPRGRPNLHFNQRINAAVELYQSGKVRHLLVSGDNHIKGYDEPTDMREDRKSTRLNSSHLGISYAVFCLKKKNNASCHGT